ncbi:MAG TPA: hypothetical protein VK574_17420 [Terracidiphilus sp.]|nr:hypothetical protein [Terracidiphilus sp.]
MAALEMLVRLTEPGGGKVAPGELAQAAALGPRSVEICFMESDGDGRLRPADMAAGFFTPPTIQGERPAPPMLDSSSGDD